MILKLSYFTHCSRRQWIIRVSASVPYNIIVITLYITVETICLHIVVSEYIELPVKHCFLVYLVLLTSW